MWLFELSGSAKSLEPNSKKAANGCRGGLYHSDKEHYTKTHLTTLIHVEITCAAAFLCKNKLNVRGEFQGPS